MKASQNRILRKFGRGWTLVEMLVVVGMIGSLAAISFPVYRSIQKKVEEQQSEMMFTSLYQAVENFETEYNYLPYIGTSYPVVEDKYKANLGHVKSFITVMIGASSSANNANFKQIKFFECQEATGSGPDYVNGIHIFSDGTASLYTPWGGEYQRLQLDHDKDGIMAHGLGAGTKATSQILLIWDWGPDKAWLSSDDWANFEF